MREILGDGSPAAASAFYAVGRGRSWKRERKDRAEQNYEQAEREQQSLFGGPRTGH
ncbi:MAG TPA: hypothetical protein VJU60_00215 [Thermoleophilaceae bacterium]|nr:hypothetical protein [Thermoleophilaceae bacterium]